MNNDDVTQSLFTKEGREEGRATTTLNLNLSLPLSLSGPRALAVGPLLSLSTNQRRADCGRLKGPANAIGKIREGRTDGSRPTDRPLARAARRRPSPRRGRAAYIVCQMCLAGGQRGRHGSVAGICQARQRRGERGREYDRRIQGAALPHAVVLMYIVCHQVIQ